MTDDKTKDKLKLYLKPYVEQITERERSAGDNRYKCPICGSGHGKHHTGAFFIHPDGIRWHCFACEGKSNDKSSGDIFRLVELVEHIEDFPDQIRFVAERFGVAIDEISDGALDWNAEIGDGEEVQELPPEEQEPAPKADFTEYIEACIARADQTDYFASRGLSPEDVKRFRLGYDPYADQWPVKGPAVVIPYSYTNDYYLTRQISDKKFSKPKSEIAGPEPIFNAAALRGEKPCFVCEGPFDAMSVILASDGAYNAVALIGVGKERLVEKLQAAPPKCDIILCFDRDPTGLKTAESTKEKLQAVGIKTAIAKFRPEAFPYELGEVEGKEQLISGCKDPNEMFVENRETLMWELVRIADEARYEIDEELRKMRDEHESNNACFRFASFMETVGNIEYTPTGFKELDDMFNGGLFPGLYIMGAVSSLGKTTLMLQIADQIAMSGKDVLYFSLEMSANELIAKSVSRETFNNCGGLTYNAKTVRELTKKGAADNFTHFENKNLNRAQNKYLSYADHLYFFEGVGDIGVEGIRKHVDRHIILTGRKPIVFIDYIQIMAPYSEKMSDKQNTDKNVTELKRLSRDKDIPVFGISSFNRQSYGEEVDMSAFKESGSIEYGSDVLLGLQPGKKYFKKRFITNPLGQKETITPSPKEAMKKCKEDLVRDIELKMLKGRNDGHGKMEFKYFTLYNCFEEKGLKDESLDWDGEIE